MKIKNLYLFMMLFNLLSCATKVKLKDYQIPDYNLGRDKFIVLYVGPGNDYGSAQLDKVQREFINAFERENPLRLETKPISFLKPGASFEEYTKKNVINLMLGKTDVDCKASGSIEGNKRDGTGKCSGTQYFELQKANKEKIPGTNYVESSSTYSSNISLPEKPGKKSLRPIFSALLDIKTEREKAILKQDEDTIAEARRLLEYSFNKKIVLAVTPKTKHFARAIDDSVDFEGVEDIIDDGRYPEAIQMLSQYPETGARNYNLAMLYESLGQFEKATFYANWLEKNSRHEDHMEYIYDLKARIARFKKVNEL